MGQVHGGYIAWSVAGHRHTTPQDAALDWTTEPAEYQTHRATPLDDAVDGCSRAREKQRRRGGEGCCPVVQTWRGN